jgi:hypothetical protein
LEYCIIHAPSLIRSAAVLLPLMPVHLPVPPTYSIVPVRRSPSFDLCLRNARKRDDQHESEGDRQQGSRIGNGPSLE